MNTANLQLQGLIMAVACISETLVEKGALTHQELAASLGSAERLVDQDDMRDFSEANKAAMLFPVRVLQLANQASQRGRKFSFADYAELVGKLT